MEARGGRVAAACDTDGKPLASLERRQLLQEFHTLYQEHLQGLEVMEESHKEVLKVKVKLLQAYALDLAVQNDILIQAVEELEGRTTERWKVKADVQRPSLALRPMPAERFPGSTATPATSCPPGPQREPAAVRPCREPLLVELSLHLQEAAQQQEMARKELLGKDAQLQDLQEAAPALLNRISQQAVETAGQHQEKALLGTHLCSPPQQMLDAREQRSHELQKQPREEQQDRERKCHRILDPDIRLEESSQQVEECAPSWKECQGSACMEAEPVLLWNKEEQAEVGKKPAGRPVGEQALWAELQDTRLLAEGAVAQLAVAEAEMAVLRSKYQFALSEAAEQRVSLHQLQERHSLLQQQLARQQGLLQQPQGQTQDLPAEAQRQTELEAELTRAKGQGQAAAEEVQQGQDAIWERQEKVAPSQASQEAAEGTIRAKEEEVRTVQQKTALVQHHLKLLQSELQQSKEQAEQRRAEMEAGRGQILRCQGWLPEANAKRQQLTRNVAEQRQQCEASQQKVSAQDVAIAELRGGLRDEAEARAQAQDELTGREAKANSLQAKLHQVQDKLKVLQEGNMVEQTRVIRQLHQEEKGASLRQRERTSILLEQPPGEWGSSRRGHQADMEELHGRLQQMQQELDICKGRNWDNLLKLQAREGTMEKAGLERDLMLCQCQILKDQLFYYEEVAQRQELALSRHQQREQHLQEGLSQAERNASILESSLDLYRQKYQASLARAGELESQLHHLQEELANQAKEKEEALLKLHAEQLALREELKDRCHYASQAEDAVAQLAQELQEAQEELSQARQLGGQSQESMEELQRQLASSRLKLREQEEQLAALHRDFASYKATHSCSNSSYEGQLARAEALRQKLERAEEESAKHRQKAEEYQDLLQDLKRELARATEQESCALEGTAHLEQRVQRLQEEAATQRERQQVEMATLLRELQQSHNSVAQKEQAIQKKDELLRRSQAEVAQARQALQEKGLEAEQHQAQARQLAARLREAQRELESSRAEKAALHMEAQELQENLRESQEQHQQATQGLAEQEEELLVAQTRLRSAQEQLEASVAEAAGHMQKAHRLEVEAQLLQERLARAEAEVEEKRDLLEQLIEELSASRQQHQAAKEEALQQRQAAARLEQKLESSREGLRSLQQQVQGHEATVDTLHTEVRQRRQEEEELQQQLQAVREQESRLAREQQLLQHQLESTKCQLQEEEWKSKSLQARLEEREAEQRALQEQRKQQALELEAVRARLDQAQQQLQLRTAEVLRQEASQAQLSSELRGAQDRERQSQQTLSAAKGVAQQLQAQVAACQASHQEALGKLEQKSQEASCLQAELQLTQHKVAHLEEELAQAQEGQERQRVATQRERQQEARAMKERLDHLSEQLQRWQAEQRAAKLALAEKEEELVVMKVELASLEEAHHRTAEEREELQNEVNLLRQKFVASSREVELLQTSLEAAQDDSHRLQHESDLVVANVCQWVKEQKQVNEKLGVKIRDQIKQVALLTGQRDRLHELVEQLQQENKQLKNEVDERRIECERLKALHSRDSDPPCATGRPHWPTLPADDPQQVAQRRSKGLSTQWHLP